MILSTENQSEIAVIPFAIGRQIERKKLGESKFKTEEKNTKRKKKSIL